MLVLGNDYQSVEGLVHVNQFWELQGNIQLEFIHIHIYLIYKPYASHKD